MKIGAMARLLRPKQWTKNLLALAALIFTGRFLEWPAVAQAAAVFASLSLASSATYALNDLLDAERDRNHPKKRFRPVASGEVSRHQAAGLSLICAAGGLGI
ncbi:MAG: UbiA family prenyltransferase, partial [Fimbriimonadaceae bacterium]|nr:UbiA family prenyltransferase [Fimbriimonadaceae bacterium]